MQKPTSGRIVQVLVLPDGNNGRDTAPAMITGVNKDGTVNVTVFPDDAVQVSRKLRDVSVHADRAAAEKELGKHVSDVPNRKNDDGEVVKPTAIDVTPWVQVAYWPERTEAPAAATPAPAKKTAAAKSAAAKSATAPAS